jgi:hypothetical protein
MNIAELKLILDTIRSLTGDATSAAYWYFGLEFAKVALAWLVGAGVVLTIIKTLAKAAGEGADEAFMRECREALGTGARGSLTDTERYDTQQAIRKLIKESKQ